MSNIRFLSALLVLLFAQSFVWAQKNTIVELPMQFRGPMPAVEVTVNGQGPFIFAIDTGGGGRARLDSSLVAKLGLKPSGQVQATDGSGQNVRNLDTYTIDSLKVGDVTFENVTAASRDYNANTSLPKIDGILAFNLFADYLLTLDYPGKKVRLEKGELPAANGANILDFEKPRGVPVVDLQIGGQKIKADIDSGNSIAPFVLPTAVVEKATPASEPVVVGTARTVSSVTEIKQVSLKDSIRLGGFEFTEPRVNYPSPSATAANIGSRLLAEFSITFDQKNNRLKLERTPTPKPPAAKIENAKDYAGTYGDRVVSEENGDLYIQRGASRRLRLVRLSKDEFTLDELPDARFKFTREAAGGKVVGLETLTREGVWVKDSRQQ